MAHLPGEECLFVTVKTRRSRARRMGAGEAAARLISSAVRGYPASRTPVSGAPRTRAPRRHRLTFTSPAQPFVVDQVINERANSLLGNKNLGSAGRFHGKGTAKVEELSIVKFAERLPEDLRKLIPPFVEGGQPRWNELERLAGDVGDGCEPAAKGSGKPYRNGAWKTHRSE